MQQHSGVLVLGEVEKALQYVSRRGNVLSTISGPSLVFHYEPQRPASFVTGLHSNAADDPCMAFFRRKKALMYERGTYARREQLALIPSHGKCLWGLADKYSHETGMPVTVIPTRLEDIEDYRIVLEELLPELMFADCDFRKTNFFQRQLEETVEALATDLLTAADSGKLPEMFHTKRAHLKKYFPSEREFNASLDSFVANERYDLAIALLHTEMSPLPKTVLEQSKEVLQRQASSR